jgi:hypothetical protein
MRIDLCVDLSRQIPRPFTRLIRNAALAAFLLMAFCSFAHSQTIDDGIMLSRGTICTGFLYTHDGWDHYWEGDLNRTNGNLGTVTTQTVDYTANYGVLSRLNVIGSLPYVWTHASRGVLHGQSGLQDITLAA